MSSSVRIVVCVDIDATTAPEAYAKLYDAMRLLPEGMDWESSDEWYGPDGEALSQDAIDDARAGRRSS